MGIETPAAALEREHREIDEAVTAFLREPADEGRRGGLRTALHELRHHIYLEEEFLFPPMREAGMMMPIFVMLREHGALWHAMAGLDAMIADDAGRPALVDAGRELLSLLDAHNSKEEPVIYTQADDILEQEATAELQDFLRSGTMPEGWVCTTA